MNRNNKFLMIVFVVLFSLSCNAVSKLSNLPTEPLTTDMIDDSDVQPTSIPIEPTQEVKATEPEEQIEATAPEPEPTEAALPLSQPAGFVTYPNDDSGLAIFDLDGNPLGRVQTPGLMSGAVQNIHIAGTLVDGTDSIPVVYFAFDEAGKLKLNIDNQVSDILESEYFVALTGAPRLPVLAYTTSEYKDNGLLNKLYVGKLGSLASAPPVVEEVDPESWALKVLAVHIENGKAKGVYYTELAFGIGGDIVFEPRQGLSYFDLDTGLSREILVKDLNPSSLSFDQKWVAYSAINWDNPQPLRVRNLANGETTTFALLPESDRGAGKAVFSPDNKRVAWLEGSGFRMAEVPDYYSVIRIGTTSGTIMSEFRDSSLSSVAGLEKMQWVEPIGWLDRDHLLLQVRLEYWDQAALVSIKFDGTDIHWLAPGNFVGFLYR